MHREHRLLDCETTASGRRTRKNFKRIINLKIFFERSIKWKDGGEDIYIYREGEKDEMD